MILIHHGAGVEDGVRVVLEKYSLVKPPYESLKAAEVRDLVSSFNQAWPIPNAAILAGPLDEADPSTLDILLKSIEEPLEGSPTLILWARDYGAVPLTIRSRCGEKYHYAPPLPHSMRAQASSLFASLRDSDLLGAMVALKGVDKGKERGLLEAFVEVVLEEGAVDDFYTEELREILSFKQISQTALYGYFLGEKS
jgi:hypothetical protein